MFCNPIMLLQRRHRPLAKRKSSLRSHHLLALRWDDVLNSSLNSRLSHSSVYNATWIVLGRPLNFRSLNEAFKHLNLKSTLKMLVNETRKSSVLSILYERHFSFCMVPGMGVRAAHWQDGLCTTLALRLLSEVKLPHAGNLPSKSGYGTLVLLSFCEVESHSANQQAVAPSRKPSQS